MLQAMISSYLIGRTILQPYFERLHRFCLEAMNFGGNADNVKRSGEIWVIHRLAQFLSDDEIAIVFDVGAHVGNYSLEVLSGFGKKLLLYIFEPSKNTFYLLRQNLASYQNVKFFNFGFGENDETAVLYSDKNLSALSSVYDRKLEHVRIEMKFKEEIKLRRLSNFCLENGINHIHLLKLDVEGNEFNVLKGAEELVNARSIDLIQFEFGGCNIDSRTFFRDFYYFLKPNYQIYRIVKNGIAPITKYNESCEIFMTVNYLAVSKNKQI